MSWDVAVIGGGHAGVEAALAAVRLGARTALITQRVDTIGLMSCNPAIGGIGKSHLVCEIDALGGAMAENTDATAIQYRILNTQKGPAVRATRAQCDRRRYAARLQALLPGISGLEILEGEAVGLIHDHCRVLGLHLADGRDVVASTVVLTTGTFLEGLLHFGDEQRPGGRIHEAPSRGLSDALRQMGLPVGRLKTGTPPRLLSESIDYQVMIPQPSDPEATALCAWTALPRLPQRSCHITYTNERTHAIIRDNLHRAPLFTGRIQGTGPRYCPSIETKIVMFADRDRHHVFIEPEGLDSPEVYPNGLSTSLPLDVQIAYVRSIRGLERAEITQPGYAVEYDFVDPREVGSDLQCRKVPGLFLAGQILGTTGYEEAGALGLLAGANAALRAAGRGAFTLDRAGSYLGVMVDDLTTRGVTEPYRMFTSRAEFRLSLREDNALDRLAPLAADVGLLDQPRIDAYQQRRQRLEAADAVLDRERLRLADLPDPDVCALPPEGLTLREALRRSDVDIENVIAWRPLPELTALTSRERTALFVGVRYAGYIAREDKEIERFRRMDGISIPADFRFADLPGLSTEVCERLSRARPTTLGVASRLEGITPAAVTALLLHLRSAPV